MTDATTGPLHGIRVVEITTMVAGPIAGLMLADLGAEVIKIESAGGDPLRHIRPAHNGMAALFMAMNRHKKSVTLDLKSEQGVAKARELVLTADVLLENARPGVLDRMGLSYEALKAIHPSLIYASVNGFGSTGPYATRAAFDQVIQALSGAMAVQNPRGAPEPIRNMFVDKYSGISAASAIIAALFHRERTGEGQKVSVSLLNAFSSFALIDNIVNDTFLNSDDRIPYVNTTRPIAARGGYLMGHIQTGDQFRKFCKVIGREDLIEDPRFADDWERLLRIEEMWAEVETTSKDIPVDELVARLAAAGLPIGRVNTVREFFEDPQTRHNQAVVEFDDDVYGRVRVLNHPARFEKTPANVLGRAPKLGEHNTEIDALIAGRRTTPDA